MKVLIFSWARTGSTSLMESLTKNGIPFIGEPFNKDAAKHDPRRPPFLLENNEYKLERALEAIWDKGFLGIKHLHDQLSPEENRVLLAQNHLKIIFLTRANLLEREISHFVAERDNSWFEAKAYREPIDTEALKSRMEKVYTQYLQYREMLVGTDYLDISYEEIFYGKKYDRVFDFLDINTKNIEDFSTDKKLKSPDYYSHIPNIQEIAGLGCDEFGYIDRFLQ